MLLITSSYAVSLVYNLVLKVLFMSTYNLWWINMMSIHSLQGNELHQSQLLVKRDFKRDLLVTGIYFHLEPWSLDMWSLYGMNLQKDAECQLPQIDVKEGRMIKMVDHNCMRHWIFRYKLVATLVHLRLLFIQQNSNICSCDFKCSLLVVISRKHNALAHPGLARNIVYFRDLSEFWNCEKSGVLVAFANSGELSNGGPLWLGRWWLNNKSRMYVLENTGKNQGGLVNLMSMGWSLPSIFAIYLLILSCDL
jgi:hypothetical protein